MSTADKLTTIAENVPKVYEAGKKSEYDAFWDDFQQNGARGIAYDYLFSGKTWTTKTFVPKYDVIAPQSVYMMFSGNPVVTDLRHLKKSNGEKMKLDFNGTWNMAYAFYSCKVTYLETVDCTTCTSCNNMFQNTPIETIELLKLRADGGNTLGAAFNSATKLINITIEGKIGYNGTNFGSMVLTKKSIHSIINALSNATSGFTLTLKENAVISAFGSVDNAEWQSLVATKPNWTISLT